jgi:hypothetical protein
MTLRRVTAGLVVALVLLLLAGSVGAVAAGSHAASPTLPTLDPFYSYTGPLSGVAPGTVLRKRTVTVAEGGNSTPIAATQVLYRTADQQGQPSVTVATVLRPATQPVVTRLVSYQTAYDALGSECDPSYTLQGGNSSYSTAQDEEQLILGYVSAGDTVVVPDYEGERLDWAAGQESGYDTLDGIRAAENLLGLSEKSTPVGMVGYSGGSIATDFASELAPSYAPNLHIVGVAEGGVPADFLHNLSYINGSPSWSGVIPAVFVSLARAFHLDFAQYLNAYGLQVTNQVKDECINNFIGAYPGLTYQKLVKPQYQDIYSVAPVVKISDELIMSRTGTPRGPMFMGVGDADGTGDGVMVTKDDEALAHTYCQRGVSVEFNVYKGDDHTSAAIPFEAGALQFLTKRLNGQSVSNGCGSIGVGNSLAPFPIPGSSSSHVTVHFRDLGRRARLRGVELQIWTRGGTLKHVVLTLRRGKRVIERVRIAKLTGKKHRVVLRRHGHMLAKGRYTLRLTQGAKTLLRRTIRVR